LKMEEEDWRRQTFDQGVQPEGENISKGRKTEKGEEKRDQHHTGGSEFRPKWGVRNGFGLRGRGVVGREDGNARFSQGLLAAKAGRGRVDA